MIAAVGAVALTASAASAATTQIDLSPYVNYDLGIGQPSGQSAGNAGTAVASQQFNLLPAVANYGGYDVWRGSATGQSVDISVNILDAAEVTTLMNTLYGVGGLATATVTFEGTGGAYQTYTLIGNSDIRDYNNWVWTNSINGTTTQEWWTNNINAVPGSLDQSHRVDAQIFALNSSFRGQTLTDIIVTAGPAGDSYSEPMLFAADVTAVPEPATWAMMLFGLGGLGALLRTRRRADRNLAPQAV